MRHHIGHAEDGPVCRKCGKPMKPETVFKGIGVKQSWRCTGCNVRIPTRS